LNIKAANILIAILFRPVILPVSPGSSGTAAGRLPEKNYFVQGHQHVNTQKGIPLWKEGFF
jgi:hypothetical protein